MDDLQIRRLGVLPKGLRALEAAALSEGFGFLTRLIGDWQSGVNRFDQPGECLLGVWRNGQLIAIGGLSVDPHATADTGRLRRFYVAPAARGLQVGKTLLQRLLTLAAPRFRKVRLFTDTEAAGAFYLRCGFQAVRDDSASHEKWLTNCV